MLRRQSNLGWGFDLIAANIIRYTQSMERGALPQ